MAMAPRLVTRPEREVDFSAVGTIGRRTGVTLPQGRLDDNGIEEISGIFSSPRKPSPLKNSIQVVDSINNGSRATPNRSLSHRKSTRGGSIPPPRSASPKKTGIGGTARRSSVFGKKKDISEYDLEDRENDDENNTPKQHSNTRRLTSTPNQSPLRDITITNTPNSERRRSLRDQLESRRSLMQSIEAAEPSEATPTSGDLMNANQLLNNGNDDYAPIFGDDDDNEMNQNNGFENDGDDVAEYDDEDVDGTFELEAEVQEKTNQPAKANSRRKRTSETLQENLETYDVDSPIAKRARTAKSKSKSKSSDPVIQDQQSGEAVSKVKPINSQRTKSGMLGAKDSNTKFSSRQEKELASIVEKVRARPGPPKSLYILRRETPADDGMTHTRSGRVSVKPLAYWRNERCIFGGSPGSSSLADGARFPLNSIKEIVRHEEIQQKSHKKTAKRKGKAGRSKSKQPVEETESSESELDDDGPVLDPNAEPWESELGTFRGMVSVWDHQQQLPIEEEKEVDIAYAAAAIQTREVKGSTSDDGPTFSYAKLLGMKFFGTGIVDLPPGGIKRPKNSRKMQMTFFVVKGRVTVQVGPIGADESGTMNRFSIGKGGFWQVPRGNQYSIENETEKPARVFFSQGCEPAPTDEDP